MGWGRDWGEFGKKRERLAKAVGSCRWGVHVAGRLQGEEVAGQRARGPSNLLPPQLLLSLI